jgi:glucose/arabinose dehydrogenase
MPVIVAVVGVALLAAVALAASSAPSLRPVVRGFSQPVVATFAPGEPGRLYVAEQGGLVKVVKGGRVLSKPFVDLRSRVTAGGEQGLLGLAFPPNYARTGVFYVNYSDRRDGATIIARLRARNGVAIPGSHTRILRVAQPYPNHNGGNLAFDRSGVLWVGLGDGGSGGDPEDRAQDPGTLLGKLFTLDVRKASPTPKIVAFGLRNPWRYSFDRATGDLWLGDVGQGEIEEISVLRRGTTGVVNFGWDAFEGSRRYEDTRLAPGKVIGPIAEYDHGQGCSVTGGYVYRGAAVPSLRGRYLFGDYCSGTIWSLPAEGGALRREPFRVENLVSFGEGPAGELYLVSHDGAIYRLTP